MRIAVAALMLGLVAVVSGGPDAPVVRAEPGPASPVEISVSIGDLAGDLPLEGIIPELPVITVPPEEPAPTPVPMPRPVPDLTPTSVPPPVPPPAPPPDESPDHPDTVDHAVQDLAAHTGVHPDSIDVVSYEEVTWHDSSLGCPQPDEMYMPVLVEGYRIVLSAAGQEYHYHGADGDVPFRCDNPENAGPDDGELRSY